MVSPASASSSNFVGMNSPAVTTSASKRAFTSPSVTSTPASTTAMATSTATLTNFLPAGSAARANANANANGDVDANGIVAITINANNANANHTNNANNGNGNGNANANTNNGNGNGNSPRASSDGTIRHSAAIHIPILAEKVALRHRSRRGTRPSSGARVSVPSSHLRGDAPRVPRFYLPSASQHNSFFARRLLTSTTVLATVMAAGVLVYYTYHPADLVLNGAYPNSRGFRLEDPSRVYTLQATPCENMVGFSALVFHAFPAVLLLALPGSGLRIFEPFQRDSETLLPEDMPSVRSDGPPAAKITRTLVFQACELMATMMLVFGLVMFLYAWYMFFNGATFSCDKPRVYLFAGVALLCFAALFVALSYFARFREHIKMQLGAFQERDQTGGVRRHLVDETEMMEQGASLKHRLRVIRKQLYRAAGSGDLEEMRTVLTLARTLRLDEEMGFPSSCYNGASLFLRWFSVSQKNPMHVAAYHGNVSAMELLAAHGFSIDTFDKFRRMRFSTGDIFWYLARFVIARPASSAGNDEEAMLAATLVTPLHCAVAAGQLQAVRWLLERGADANAMVRASSREQRVPPLFLAETPEVARVLLESGADVLAIPDAGHLNTLTALQQAYLWGNFAVAHELETWGGDVALTPFHQAAGRNDTATVRRLIRRGANLQCLGEHGYHGLNRRTPLHWAAVNGATECVDLLLEAGADPNFQDAQGRTPLHWAARLNRAEIVESLLASGHAEANVADEEGCTPLVCAAMCRSASQELCASLVAAGGDIDYAMPTTGDTALHVAVRAEHGDSALALLACGGDLMQTNLAGMRPLDCSTDTTLLFEIKRAAGHRDVMISYTHSHAEFAQKLRGSLESANITTWLDLMDPSGIGGGAVWREEIARGITNAALVVCILTEDYAHSEWCLKELALAKQAGTPILAVSTEGVSIGEDLQVYLYTRQIIPFEPSITSTQRNAQNARQIEYSYDDNKYRAQFRLLLDGVRDEIEKHRSDEMAKNRNKQKQKVAGKLGALGGTSFSSSALGFTTMFQPWDGGATDGDTPFVFVSHGDHHSRFVGRLCDELREKGIAYYGDRNADGDGGQSFDARIQHAKDAILKCSCVVVILSRQTMGNELVRDQLAFAEDKGRPIFPVVLNDVEIGYDKRYSLARTDFFHFLSDGVGFNSSFDLLFNGLRRHCIVGGDRSTNSVSSQSSGSISRGSGLGHGGSLHLAPATLGGSFVSNNSFVSFIHTGDAYEGDTEPGRQQEEMILEDEVHGFDRGRGSDMASEEDYNNSTRNLDSLSSLASNDRQNVDVVRM